jgi:hypothetical protein
VADKPVIVPRKWVSAEGKVASLAGSNKPVIGPRVEI